MVSVLQNPKSKQWQQSPSEGLEHSPVSRQPVSAGSCVIQWVWLLAMEKRAKESRESKEKYRIWHEFACERQSELTAALLSRSPAGAKERSWAARCQPAEAGHRRDDLLTYSWQLSQIADVFESSYFKGFTAVFLRQDLNEEREAVPWTRSGKVIARRNPVSCHIRVKIDTTFYIRWWLDN